MHNAVRSGNLYTPEIAAVIAGGITPEYNVFPFSGAYRDLSSLLTNPNTDFANNVQAAASGMLTGLVHDGSDPQELASNVLFYGRQIEAARQLERQQKAAEHAREHKEEAPKKEKKVQRNNKDEPSSPDKKQTAANEKLSLPEAASETVTAIGKTIAHLIKSEFIVSLPTAKLGTLVPASVPSAPSIMHNRGLAGFYLHS